MTFQNDLEIGTCICKLKYCIFLIALINMCIGIMSLHSFLKISIIYDTKYHAHSYFDSNVNLGVLLASMKLALM